MLHAFAGINLLTLTFEVVSISSSIPPSTTKQSKRLNSDTKYCCIPSEYILTTISRVKRPRKILLDRSKIYAAIKNKGRTEQNISPFLRFAWVRQKSFKWKHRLWLYGNDLVYYSTFQHNSIPSILVHYPHYTITQLRSDQRVYVTPWSAERRRLGAFMRIRITRVLFWTV